MRLVKHMLALLATVMRSLPWGPWASQSRPWRPWGPWTSQSRPWGPWATLSQPC
jgi:hypothetical protein